MNKLISISEAIAKIKDGDAIMVGGFLANGTPERLIDALDLLSGAKKVIVAMEHTSKGSPKILKQCTLPLTAEAAVDLIITEMAVIKVTPEGLVLTEINPEFTLDEVINATEAKLIIDKDLNHMVVN